MKILILGATGFIGKEIAQTLKKDGHALLSYRDKTDFMHLPEHTTLVEMLREVDILINAVGIIAETKNKTFKQIHTLAPIALFKASKEAGVKKVIQISALGSEHGTTTYHSSKNRADAYLRESALAYAILHPSIVYGDDGKSTALFQALATLPLIPIVGDGQQLLQPIRIEDLVATVKKAIASTDSKIELNVVGAHTITYESLLQTFRKYLGYKETKSITVPTFGTDIIGKILEEPTVSHDNIKMLNEGNAAEVTPLANFLGYTPVGFKEHFENTPSYHSQKLYASLYLLRPFLRMVLGLVWIWSGVVSAFLYPQPLALALLHEVGVPVGLDIPLLYVASFLDISIGILTLIGYRLQALLALQVLVIAVYTLLLTLLAPHHWLHPFGPVLKNIPLLFAIYILSRLEKFR